MSLDPKLRNRSRRLSACCRHPSQPVTGFCALCLHERLAGLHPEPAPDLRRSKSVSASKCEASSSSFSEPRRKSCDVRPRNTLSNLFNLDDETKGSVRVSKVESKNLEEIRVINVSIDDEVEGEAKTMKELIDLELQRTKERDLRDIAGSFWAAASVFSKKLQKWRQKKVKKRSDFLTMRVDKRIRGQLRETQSEVGDYGFGRRSCDTEPRFSIDAGRMSLDDTRFAMDEPRASWDGYLIARTIPRLTPMLATVNHSIIEDETTSGGSAHTNSDSSSSKRGSSFDRSSSFQSSNRKTLGLEADEVKSITNGRSKLVITERELKDWHLKNALKDDHSEIVSGSRPNQLKKSSRWRKVCNIWGPKLNYTGNVNEACEKQCQEGDGVETGASFGGLTRSSSCVSSNNSMMMIGSYNDIRSVPSVVKSRGSVKKSREDIVVERNRSNGYSSGSFDNGLLRFHLTPFRSYRRSKSGKTRLQQSHSMARNPLG